jgi:hypothetical protein
MLLRLLALLKNFLSASLIGPEVGLGDFFFERAQQGLVAWGVKDSSERAEPAL